MVLTFFAPKRRSTSHPKDSKKKWKKWAGKKSRKNPWKFKRRGDVEKFASTAVAVALLFSGVLVLLVCLVLLLCLKNSNCRRTAGKRWLSNCYKSLLKMLAERAYCLPKLLPLPLTSSNSNSTNNSNNNQQLSNMANSNTANNAVRVVVKALKRFSPDLTQRQRQRQKVIKAPANWVVRLTHLLGPRDRCET